MRAIPKQNRRSISLIELLTGSPFPRNNRNLQQQQQPAPATTKATAAEAAQPTTTAPGTEAYIEAKFCKMGLPVRRRNRKNSDPSEPDGTEVTAAGAETAAAAASDAPAGPDVSAGAAGAEPFELRQRVGLTEISFVYCPGSEICKGVALGPFAWLCCIVALLLLLALLRIFSGSADT